MAERKEANNRWAKLNQAAVLTALREQSDSEYWATCCEFVQFLVNTHFSTLRPQIKEEVVQDILLLVHQNLATFRGESQFTTWLARIVRNRAIDILRRQKRPERMEVYMEEPPETHEDDGECSYASTAKTPEEIALTLELLQEALEAMNEYIQTHGKAERNRHIVRLVLCYGYSQKQVAQMLDVPEPVVGYIVRSARKYIRQRLTEKESTDPGE